MARLAGDTPVFVVKSGSEARKDRPKLASIRDGVKIGLFLCRRRLERGYENVGQTQVEKKNRDLTELSSKARISRYMIVRHNSVLL